MSLQDLDEVSVERQEQAEARANQANQQKPQPGEIHHDPVNWGQKDYWATPLEFMAKFGDCEDYAIAKFMSLRRLGWKTSKCVVAVKDLNLKVGHAILVVYLDDKVYVLDNQIKQVIEAGKDPSLPAGFFQSIRKLVASPGAIGHATAPIGPNRRFAPSCSIFRQKSWRSGANGLLSRASPPPRFIGLSSNDRYCVGNRQTPHLCDHFPPGCRAKPP